MYIFLKEITLQCRKQTKPQMQQQEPGPGKKMKDRKASRGTSCVPISTLGLGLFVVKDVLAAMPSYL